MSQTKAQLINAKGDAAFDTNTLYVDAANNRVGIGTSAPDQLLHVVNSGSNGGTIQIGSQTVDFGTSRLNLWGTDNYVAFRHKNVGSNNDLAYVIGGPANLGTDNSGYLAFGTRTAGNTLSERVRIDPSGRVGIGNTTPGNFNSVANQVVVGSGSGDAGITLSTGTSSSGYLAFCDTGNTVNQGWYGYSHTDNALLLGANSSERARIDSSGRLLVGTSTARSNFFNSTFTSQVQIEGTTNNTASAALIRSSVDNGGTVLYFAKQRGSVGANGIVANGDRIATLSFQGSDGSEFVEAAKIDVEVDGTPGTDDMPGRLVFSTTADGANSPTQRMQINNEGILQVISTSFGFVVSTTGAAGSGSVLISGRNAGTAGSVSSGTVAFTVAANGNVTNTNGSYTAISDAKLKENITDAQSQWDDLKAIRIRNWNFKVETGHETHRQIGPIAQELEAVCPGLVFEIPDLDEEGKETGEVTKGVNQSVLYMKAVKALQEAMERIEQLETEMAAVKAQLP